MLQKTKKCIRSNYLSINKLHYYHFKYLELTLIGFEDCFMVNCGETWGNVVHDGVFFVNLFILN